VHEAKDEDSTSEKSESKQPFCPGQLAEPKFSLRILSDIYISNLCMFFQLKQFNFFFTGRSAPMQLTTLLLFDSGRHGPKPHHFSS